MVAELAVELGRLEQEGRTGMLCAGDGAFHLAGGAIASVECRRTAGLDRLAVEAGVVSAREWDRAGGGDAGSLLGRPRLEALAMLSVYDAGYFLLASDAVAEFRPAPAHWLAPVCRVPPRALMRECRRRGGGESGPWPADLVDSAPVVPVRGRHRRRPPLPGGQAEVLAAADSERTVAAIARDLGRTTYGCLVAVRDLTGAGLIEHPRVPAPAPPLPRPPLPPTPSPLPRRRSRGAVDQIPQRWEPVDRRMLVRVLSALEELE